MNDPIGAFEKLRESLVLYIQTAFGTQFPGLERERERLLREPGVISQEPWIEPLPRYVTSGKRIRDLTKGDVPSLTFQQLEQFKQLAGAGLVGEFPLHKHQLAMLAIALAGRNCVVTAGTGSGKTESFLLPLFAYLVRESEAWTTPGRRPQHWSDWWKNDQWRDECDPMVGKQRRMRRSLRVSQRGHETRPPAVRGLILYPMNALVEDQMSRLRRALDSPAAQSWFREYRQGNRFYIGRYNSGTPVPGHEVNPPNKAGHATPNRSRIEHLAKELRAVEDAASVARRHSSENPANEDVRYFFPALDGAEMRSRWDMQDSPPDILITNYSMLSIMLMRDADAGIFAKTKQWLELEGSIFHLIVDELHLYRGTAGSEVAYLLRLLLLRLGLSPTSPKLRILGASASLEPDDIDSRRYLTEFFGVPWGSDQIIPGVQEPAADAPAEALAREPFIGLARYAATGQQDLITAAAETAAALGADADDGSVAERLSAGLSVARVGARMLAACSDASGPRAVGLQSFARSIFGDVADTAAAYEAARGLLFARGLVGQTPAAGLPAFRLHWFFRNIEGLWACTRPACGCRDEEQDGRRTCGQLFMDSRIVCRHESDYHRVLELLYCEQCGTTLFGGSRMELPMGAGWELVSTDPDIEGIPDRQAARFIDRRRFSEFAVFWPSGSAALNPDATPWRQPILTGGSVQGRWVRAANRPHPTLRAHS